MKTQLDMDKIARELGAERSGKVVAKGGQFGALQLAAEVHARFRVPAGGGRATAPEWTERRLLPLRPKTLKRLEILAAKLTESGGVAVEPMQVAALLLERVVDVISDDEVEEMSLLPGGQRRKSYGGSSEK
jgi:hypothetical protein